MKAPAKILTLSFSFLLTICIVNAQEKLQKITNKNFLNGYAKKIIGKDISYHSFHPYATDALLTRCTDGTMAIVWETDTIPSAYHEDAIYFGWIAGYSRGTKKIKTFK